MNGTHHTQRDSSHSAPVFGGRAETAGVPVREIVTRIAAAISEPDPVRVLRARESLVYGLPSAEAVADRLLGY